MTRHTRGTRRPLLHWLLLPALLALIAAFAVACGDDDEAEGDDEGGETPQATSETGGEGGEGGALKIGLLFPFSGDLADFGPAFLQSAQLAVDEINNAGGVNGQPIEIAQGDDGTSAQQGVAEARRLIDIEGVNAIIGAAASGVTLQVAESVTGPGSILQISSSATSPALTVANDNDFLFRAPISDAAQGVILAQVADEQGVENACTLYTNNAYGQGLSKSFSDAFTALGGTVTAQVPHEEQATTYVSELGQCEGASTLVAISYPESAGVYLREAVEQDLFDNFLFVDGTKSQEMIDQLGAENFEGVFGTAPGSLDRSVGADFATRYEAAYGELPEGLPFLRETYDTVYLIALAAQAAGSNDSTAIRDALRDVANPEGTTVNPGEEGWTAALAALDAGEDVDYDGASSPLDFDEAGDVLLGAIEIWQVVDGTIEVQEVREVDLNEGA